MTLALSGWCQVGDHANCNRKSRGFYFEGKKLIWRDNIIYCSCKVRKCPCYKQEKVPFDKAITDVELP